MDEQQLTLAGKSGTKYTFFPRFSLAQDAASKGSGIYVFTIGENTIVDIQFLDGDNEISDTFRRMHEDGAEFFYFKDEADELESDKQIDDMKEGQDYRSKVE